MTNAEKLPVIARGCPKNVILNPVLNLFQHYFGILTCDYIPKIDPEINSG